VTSLGFETIKVELKNYVYETREVRYYSLFLKK